MKIKHNIIRIEHPSSGLGYFNARDEEGIINSRHSQSRVIVKRHANQNQFPNYYGDCVLNQQIDLMVLMDKNYFYAFNDLQQFENAFTREEVKECIEKLGFVVLMMDVTDYYESPYQVVFRKESIVSKKDISSMFL